MRHIALVCRHEIVVPLSEGAQAELTGRLVLHILRLGPA